MSTSGWATGSGSRTIACVELEVAVSRHDRLQLPIWVERRMLPLPYIKLRRALTLTISKRILPQRMEPWNEC